MGDGGVARCHPGVVYWFRGDWSGFAEPVWSIIEPGWGKMGEKAASEEGRSSGGGRYVTAAKNNSPFGFRAAERGCARAPPQSATAAAP